LIARQIRRPAVFLDRDGVLNEAVVVNGRPTPPQTLADLHLRPGAIEACAKLHDAGYALVVVTNQPDIARGTQTHAEVSRMHAWLREALPLEEIVTCVHDDDDNCRCRKPRPGMFLDAADRLGLDLSVSVCVGDRWRDVEAARRAGIRAVFVECHYDEPAATGADLVVGSLLEAVPWICSLENRSNRKGNDA
jgi:D-glycero-D-manno-heptose 1,7-bisphosphate phosphatase